MGRVLFISILAAFLLASSTATAQQREFNFMTVGLQFRPLIPSDLLRTSSETITGNEVDGNDFLRMSVDQKLGYSFGMTIRKNFSQRFAIETGVNFLRRGYDVNVTDLDSGLTDMVDFGISAYEIPLTALVYIRLGEQLFMNTALGFSLDVGARSVANNTRAFDHFTAIRKFNGGIVANVGLEWRTKESGSIYVGATYHLPTGPIADTKINYYRTGGISDGSLETSLNGSYLTLDLRYYFHESIDGKRR